jgi:hypothetical protein
MDSAAKMGKESQPAKAATGGGNFREKAAGSPAESLPEVPGKGLSA